MCLESVAPFRGLRYVLWFRWSWFYRGIYHVCSYAVKSDCIMVRYSVFEIPVCSQWMCAEVQRIFMIYNFF